MPDSPQRLIDPIEYHAVMCKLRDFFNSKGFIEVPTQPRLSILAACEDVGNLADFSFGKEKWPLPQTGQMWLEYELLTRPNVPGYYCQTTSYRFEKNPVPGRHDFIFPLFEFEQIGGLKTLTDLETDLLQYIGYKGDFKHLDYLDVCKLYDVKDNDLTHKHEMDLYNDYGPVCFLEHFPISTSPFWNMKMNLEKSTANKCDVILSGHECIGSAERSCDKEVMRNMFYNISDGQYAKTLFDRFDKYRVEKELNEFLSLPMIERCGGGIGVTRLLNSLKVERMI